MTSKAGRAMPVEVNRIAEFSGFLTMGTIPHLVPGLLYHGQWWWFW